MSAPETTEPSTSSTPDAARLESGPEPAAGSPGAEESGLPAAVPRLTASKRWRELRKSVLRSTVVYQLVAAAIAATNWHHFNGGVRVAVVVLWLAAVSFPWWASPVAARSLARSTLGDSKLRRTTWLLFILLLATQIPVLAVTVVAAIL